MLAVQTLVAFAGFAKLRSCALIEQFALSHNLRAGDAIIAATAIENDIMLCTTNVKHYRQIPMLSLFPLKVA